MSRKKTILLIRNIHRNAYGGAEIYQNMLYDCLKKNNLNPIIFSSSRPLIKKAKTQKKKAHSSFYLPIQNWSGIRNLFLPLYFIWQILLFIWYIIIIIIYRPAALHIQSRDDFIAGTLAGKMLRRKVIWTDHSDLRLVVWENVEKKYKNPIGKTILKLAKLPDAITTISNYEYNYINKLIAPRKLPNFIVVKNGAFDKYSDYKETEPDPNSICYIGRLEDYKGVVELTEAFKKVSETNPKAELHFYGDGPMLSQLEKCQSEKIHIHGHTDKPIEAMSKSMIFVLPSYHEGLSLSLIDASMMGRAIIATSIDGNPEVVEDGKSGLLIPVKNVDALKDALDKLLESPSLAKRFGKAARKKYEEEFDFEKIVKDEIIELY